MNKLVIKITSIILFVAIPTTNSIWVDKVTNALPDWEIIQCDEKPTVEAGTHTGYRLLLRKGHKESLDMNQQLPSDSNILKNLEFVIKYTHIDLVIFPTEEGLTEKIKELIPWEQVEQEHFAMPVYMGRGYGYEWFVRSTLYYQEYLRQKLELEGGEDRLQLLVDGLFIDDKGSCTRNSVELILGRAGDKALPYIKRAVEENMNNEPGRAVRPLAHMRSEKSTQLLKSLYALPETRSSAAYALIHEPYRKEAKVEYLDMLNRRSSYLSYAALACVHFNWKEAIPILNNICAKPDSYLMFRDAFIAKCKLEGRPIQDILQAQETFFKSVWTPDEVDPNALLRAKQSILNSPDKEAAVVIALTLAFFDTKATRSKIEPVNETGWDILRALPTQVVKKVLETIINSPEEEQHQMMYRELEEFLYSLDSQKL